MRKLLLIILEGIIYVFSRTAIIVFFLLLIAELSKLQAQSLNMNRDIVVVEEIIEVDSLEEEIVDTNIKDSLNLLIPDTLKVYNNDIIPSPTINSPSLLHPSEYNWESQVIPAKIEQNAFNLNASNLNTSNSNVKIELSELTEKGIYFEESLDSVVIERVPKIRKDEFFKKMYPKCKEFEKKYQISAPLMYYQLAIESAYGTSINSQSYTKAFRDRRKGYEKLIRQGCFNFSGEHCSIKGIHDPNHCVAGIDSKKRVYFVRYNSIEECLEGYVKFLKKNGYMKLAHSLAKKHGKSLTNFFIWKYAVVSKGYCEDKNYYDTLLTSMNNKLQLYRTK